MLAVQQHAALRNPNPHSEPMPRQWQYDEFACMKHLRYEWMRRAASVRCR